MKKKLIFLLTAGLTLCIAAGCASKKPAQGSAAALAHRKVPNGFPDFVKAAIKNQPEDAVIGIGVAKLGSLNQSMIVSATRARADISRQMNTLVKDMVTDYQASSELDTSSALSYQENVTVALSKSKLAGAAVVDQNEDSQGRVWTIVSMNKTRIVEEINQAAAAAKLSVPKMAAFDAAARMDKAFNKLTEEELQAVDN
ncbi:MAG: hypothetical protein LBD20_06385 [Spirochaetaceae bacterium]|jgi:hypothetical protein|nr:hypothetical protein [Spirochaetaceae bacterium]